MEKLRLVSPFHFTVDSIGNTYAGCPTCADDIVLLSLNNNEMQEMLDTVLDYARDHRFQIHPVKSNEAGEGCHILLF
jgi:hypothetical protein